MSQRTAERTLEALEDQARDDGLEDELLDVAEMSDEELAAEMRAVGLDPGAVKVDAEEIAERAAKQRQGAPAGVRRLRRPMWLAAAAVLLLFGALAATEGAAIVAWMHEPKPEPIQPDNERAPPPTPHEIAEKLRDEAEHACEKELWGLCWRKLDEAKSVDAAGEAEERVQGLRETVKRRTTPPPGPDKPGKGGRVK
jgi:hypothetical protein